MCIMDKSQQNNDRKTPSGARNIRDSVHGSGIIRFINRLHSTSTIYIVSGLSQIVLGLAIIIVSFMGYLRPLWLSTVLTAVSSLSAMVGFFLVYHTISKIHDPNQLLRSAMKRVMESKN